MLHPAAAAGPVAPDANAYTPFRQLDTAVVANLIAELDPNAVDEPTALVGALTKALCCVCVPPATLDAADHSQTSIGFLPGRPPLRRIARRILGSSSSRCHQTCPHRTSPS